MQYADDQVYTGPHESQVGITTVLPCEAFK